MRLETIMVLVCIAFCGPQLGAAPPPTPHNITFGSLHAETLRGSHCDITVRGTQSIGEHRELSVICAGKTLFLKKTSDFLLDIQTDSSNRQRFFIRWEGGQTRLQVLELTLNSANEDIIAEKFNESSEFMPDILASPDVLLLHREKRFDAEGKIVPSRTDVFSWTGDKYALISSWKWKQGMQYDDRFCILRFKAVDCPVVQLPQHE